MNKPNGQRCDTRPPSTIHQCIAAPCSIHCSRVQCTAVCQKPGAGVRGVHPVSAMAPSGWGQVLARARACPPVLEVDIPISPCGGDPFPESHSPHRQWLPSNNIARILIAFCFFSGLFYQKTYSLYGGNALFPCLWVIWDWQVMYTSFNTQDMDPDDSCF